MSTTLLTAVAIQGGIIRVIMPDGQVRDFAQRGLKRYTEDLKLKFIKLGIVLPQAFTLPELPKKYSIQFECPEIQGRAYASFNPYRNLN